MQLIWLTDIHLNFIDYEMRLHFYREVVKATGDKILITGDIAEAPSVSNLLKEMVSVINKPIYFVLGNHDYYYGQVGDVREEMNSLTKTETLLNWLPATGPQLIKEGTVLLGQDGWADGRYGDYGKTEISVNDSRLISDLFHSKMLGKYSLLDKMQKLADEDAKQLQDNLTEAMRRHNPNKIIIMTHVPPFKEACLHESKIASADYLPFFAAKASGDVLIESAKANTDIEFLVLCGHSHSKAHWQPLNTPNLIVKVGSAEYKEPEIQESIHL